MRHLMIAAVLFCLFTPPTISFVSNGAEAVPRQATDTEGPRAETAATDDPGDSDSKEQSDAGFDLPDPDSAITHQLQTELEGDFDAEKIVVANQWIASSMVVDWLGPLAPVAISPFFGVACLSGLSLYSPDWIADNALLQSAGPLKNPWLFGTFLVLAIATSLPRLTKVSKPVAQALDRLEAYAVIVILIAIKISTSWDSDAGAEVAVVQMGFFQFTLDTLLACAVVVNILVINSVKFFFEFLVWLTPVPFLDAVFEVCNKTLCASLMLVYAFSPTLATVINLSLLVMAAIIFRWVNRRVRFYRTMLLDPILARLWPAYARPSGAELVVFPNAAVGPFGFRSRLKLSRDHGGDGWRLSEGIWWKPKRQTHLPASCRLEICHGWLTHSLRVHQPDGEMQLTFSRRYDAALAGLAEQIGISLPAEATRPDQLESPERLAGELA